MARHVKARFKSGRWQLSLGRETFPVDSAVVYVSSLHEDGVTGVVIQSHGMDQSVAECLDRDTLRTLGVGGPRNSHHDTRHFVGRAQLTTEGRVEFER